MIDVGRNYTPQGGLVVRKRSLVIYLFVLALIGLHLRLTMYAGSTPVVPNYLILFSTATMVVMYQREILASVGTPLAVLGAFVLLAPMFSAAPSNGYFARIPSLLSFLSSIISSVGLYVALRHVPHARLRRIAVWMWIVLISLALLERTALGPLFSAIRESLYMGSGRGVYDQTERDLSLYGQVRITAFASEPSFLAFTLSTLSSLAYFVHPAPRSIQAAGQYFGMILISYYIAPSLVYAFFLLATIVWALWPKTSRGFMLGGIVICGVCVVLLPFSSELSSFLLQLAGSRAQTGSFFGRILVAPQAGLDVLAEWPLAGVGVGNDQAALPIIKQIWNDSGAFAIFPWFNNVDLRAQDLMSSGFWWQWIFLGLFGGLAFIGIIAWILRNLRVEYPFRSILCSWIIWYSGSAFVDAISWFILAIVSLSAVAPTAPRPVSPTS